MTSILEFKNFTGRPEKTGVETGERVRRKVSAIGEGPGTFSVCPKAGSYDVDDKGVRRGYPERKNEDVGTSLQWRLDQKTNFSDVTRV